FGHVAAGVPPGVRHKIAPTHDRHLGDGGRLNAECGMRNHSGRNLYSSAPVIAFSRYPNVPFCLASEAASTRPVIAARYKEEAKLIRLTPASINPATLNDLPRIVAMKFTGFDTAEQTAWTDARSGRAGANNTSAPAFS